MADNNQSLKSGEYYTIKQLFSGERRIIIPDLQRDYCWGDDTNFKGGDVTGELVSDFIISLIQQFEHDPQSSLNIGLFYGYEIPANHIQLCDGQQRLTTLYLLIGMINKRIGGYRKLLISRDDVDQGYMEPYLNYAIRESTTYFLNDLITRFFIDNSGLVIDIRQADWYFQEYNLDPSINSMISALGKIESILNEYQQKAELSPLGDWLCSKLTFMYYDMGSRKNGEETFVVINTTGEPLTPTQNIKPLVINDKINSQIKNIARSWEQIETWFWARRQKKVNDTADSGFGEFLRWISIIEMREDKNLVQGILKGDIQYSFPYQKVDFNKIEDYWKALKWIVSKEGELFIFGKNILSPEANPNVHGRSAINQNECFCLLPLLYFVSKYRPHIESDAQWQRHTLRIYQFFKNLMRINSLAKDVNSLVTSTLSLIDLINPSTGDIISIIDRQEDSDNEKGISRLLSKEELIKLQILHDNPSERREIEELFWKLQGDKSIWSGEILPIIEWASDGETFDFSLFKQYAHLLMDLFPDHKDGHSEMMYLLRRSIIINQGNSYMPHANGYYESFGWKDEEWREILSREGNETKQLLDYLSRCKGLSYEVILSKYISDAIAEGWEENGYGEFAKDDFLLSFTRDANACDMIWLNSDWQITTSGSISRHTTCISRTNALFFKEFGGSCRNKDDCPVVIPNKYEVWYQKGDYNSNCIVFKLSCGLFLEARFHYDNDEGEEGVLSIILRDGEDYELSSYPVLQQHCTLLDGYYRITKSIESYSPQGVKADIEEEISKVSNLLSD